MVYDQEAAFEVDGLVELVFGIAVDCGDHAVDEPGFGGRVRRTKFTPARVVEYDVRP